MKNLSSVLPSRRTEMMSAISFGCPYIANGVSLKNDNETPVSAAEQLNPAFDLIEPDVNSGSNFDTVTKSSL